MNWLKLLGWELDLDTFKEVEKSIIIEAPHTSNWDFFFGILAALQSDVNFYFIIKKEWNLPFLGSIFKKMGAIFIDRSKPTGLTMKITEKLKLMPNGHIIFTPEGTRSRVKKWKSGFYHIAIQSNLPISVGYIDYQKKKIGIHHIFYPSGDIEKDCEKLRSFYNSVTPKNKNNYTSNWVI